MITITNMTKKLLVIIYISAFFISCSSEFHTWDKAKLKNDIISYEYYIEEYPNGRHIDSAKYFIENLYILYKQTPPPFIPKITPPVLAWDNSIIDSLSIHISVSARQSKDYELKTESKYYNFIKDILNEIGVVVVHQNLNLQTKLIVDLKAEVFGASYENIGYQYLGYELEGVISLVKKGENSILLPFNLNRSCPPVTTYSEDNKTSTIQRWSNPENALYNSFKAEMFFRDFFFKVWGPSPLLWIETYNKDLPPELKNDFEGKLSKELTNNIIRACYSNHFRIKPQAMALFPLTNPDSETALSVVLYGINKRIRRPQYVEDIELSILASYGISALEAVPTLILYYKNRRKQGSYENRIFETLKSITGENFNNDVKSWTNWWVNN